MANDITIIEATQAVAVSKRGNYEVTSPLTGATTTLTRDVDFGVIPKTKAPTLYKSGAEKVCMAYGLLQHYTIESKVERFDDDPFGYYLVKCELVKLGADGKEYVFTTGFGSANTKEKRNGFNSCFDALNSAAKMAAKRALVAAAISVAGLSGMFTQDMENENFMQNYKDVVDSQDENSPVTAKQIKRLYAIGGEAGMNAAQVKNKLIAMGYASTKEITQGKYDEVCKALAEAK